MAFSIIFLNPPFKISIPTPASAWVVPQIALVGPVASRRALAWRSRQAMVAPCFSISKNHTRIIGKSLEHHFSVFIYGKFMERCDQKLRRIILLHFGLVTFRFHHGSPLKPFIFMISGFSDVSMTPQTNYFYLWIHQDTFKNARTHPESLLKAIVFIHIEKWKVRTLQVLETIRTEQPRRSVQ